MSTVKLAGFDGIVPRAAATALGNSQAQTADNVKLYSGELRYWLGPKKVLTPWTAGARTIYRHFDATVNSRWLVWTTDVNVVTGPSADQTDMRLYYTGEASPRKTNYAMSGSVNTTGYMEMGVPAPGSAPSVGTTSGSAAVADTRAYVVTFVNTFGSLVEESAPSPASDLVTVGIGQAATITSIPNPPAGQYNWTAKRIYRTIAGTSSGANYAFVAEIGPSTTSYTDDLAAASLGSGLTTLGWLPPPSDLKGLVSLPGGVLAGFVGNTVYFSEPYFPHAWPLKYAINVPVQIIALGVFGTSVVVMTTQNPFVITGGIPGSMSSEQLPLAEPCVSKASVVYDENGVTYASPNGLVLIGPDTRELVTRSLFRREDWQKFSPSTVVGAVFDGRYFGFFQSPTLGNQCMVLTRDDVPAMSILKTPSACAHVDSRNAKLFYAGLDDGDIYEADADDQNPLAFEWRSKRFVLGSHTAFSAIKVDADYEAVAATALWNEQIAAIIAENLLKFAAGDLGSTFNACPLNTLVLNGSTLGSLPLLSSSRSVQVFVYSQGNLLAQKSMLTPEPIRLPPFRVREMEIVISGNVPVRSLAIATSVQELAV